MKIKILAMGSIGTNCYVVSDDAGNAAIIDCDRSNDHCDVSYCLPAQSGERSDV